MNGTTYGLPAALVLVGLAGIMRAQMVSPEIDREPGPFSYFSRSVDQLGVPGAVSGAELTPEGGVYNGFGELIFLLGPEQTPVNARVRMLEQGHLPVYHFTTHAAGLEYGFTVFAANVGTPSQVVNFVRVSVHNPGAAPRAAFVTSAMRYQGQQTTGTPTGDDEFRRPIADQGLGQFHQPGEAFRKDWVYGVEGHAFLRDQHVLYLFPGSPAPQLALTLHEHYNRTATLDARALDIQPTTPALVAAYRFVVPGHAAQTLDFKMPLLPVAPGGAVMKALDATTFDEAHAATVATWEQLLGHGMRIDVPESKVNETFDASLVYDLMALTDEGEQRVQTVNEFQYHRFYLRDAADFVRMYDATGYPDVASQVLAMFPTRQQKDGNFLSQPGQFDGWGETLWAFGEHYRRTHDLAFAKQMYPTIPPAVDWLIQARAADPLHLMPKSDVRDNEYVAAHLTGYNFLALGGLQSAIELAQATGHAEDAARFQREYDSYYARFFTVLDKLTASDGGYIPPALDAVGWQGTDWGNLLSVTPVPLLDAHDARVTATLQHVQARYQEGIATYTEPDDGTYLHHYLTIKNTLTELVRGDQQQAIREFYAELLHTSSTHAGFEYAIRPWGSRDVEGNLPPHGWFAADYRNLLRNMMLREENGSLHLLSAVSPAWIGRSKSLHVAAAPSYFGVTALDLTMPSDTSAVLVLKNTWSERPQALVLHLPWFMQTTAASVDGRPVDFEQGAITLPPEAREVKLQWHRRAGASQMSYDRTVASYIAEYRRRYEHLLATGEMSPATDTWRVPEH